MAPYFSCYRCDDTKHAMQTIDMDCGGYVDRSEFNLYLKWAVYQYSDIKDADELLSIVFQKGIIPAMQASKTIKASFYSQVNKTKLSPGALSLLHSGPVEAITVWSGQCLGQ